MICIELMFLATIVKPPPLGLGKCRQLTDPASRPPDYFTVLLSCSCIGSHHLSPTVRSRPLLHRLSVWAGSGKSCSLVSSPTKCLALNHQEHNNIVFYQLRSVPTCPQQMRSPLPTVNEKRRGKIIKKLSRIKTTKKNEKIRN